MTASVADRMKDLNNRLRLHCGLNLTLQRGASDQTLTVYRTGGGRYLQHYAWPNPLDYASSPTMGVKEADEYRHVLLDVVEEEQFKPDGYYGDCHAWEQGDLCGAPDCRTCGPMYEAYWARKEET